MAWHDDGMDWSAPDSAAFKYTAAIRDAMFERYSYCGLIPPAFLRSPGAYRPLSITMFSELRQAIRALCPYFIDRDSSPPEPLAYRALLVKDGCNIAEMPPSGCLIPEMNEYLKKVRNAINELSFIDIYPVKSRQVSGYTENYGTPHYSVTLIDSPGIPYSGPLYADGHADDALEVIVGGVTAFTDHDPNIDGHTHSYEDQYLCDIPAATPFTIKLWDTKFDHIRWTGQFYIRFGAPVMIDFEFRPDGG